MEIKLKGMSDSILRCIIPEELPSEDFSSAFEKLFANGMRAMSGARVVLDFGGRALSEKIICLLLSDFVWPSGVSVAAWITYDSSSQDILKRAGLPTSEPVSGEGGAALSSSLVLLRSFRSGQRVEHRGDVIIFGHVNYGAEVLASGSVTILGRLNGVAHAGYEGDENISIVAARSMEALQVRVGSKMGSLDRGAQWWGKPVIVRVEDGMVRIEYWPALKKD
jgi:septum site-determining protein MinC